MIIVAITSCTMGVGHTYIARDRLIEAAQNMGDTIKVETQGSIGVENELTAADVAAADFVLIAADLEVQGQDRFTGKPIVRVPVVMAIKQPTQLIEKIKQKMEEKQT